MTQPHHPQDGPQWQPTYAQPPQPRKNWFARNKTLSVILGLGLLVLTCCGGLAAVIGGGDTGTSASSSSPDQTEAQDNRTDTGGSASTSTEGESQAGIGDRVRDGKFEFVVTSVKPGVASVGSDFLAEEAQGQFVLVEIQVSNIGDEAQTMFDTNQKIIDAKGRSFEANSTAAIAIEGNSDVWLTDINPGNTATGTLVFDMPKGAEPATIELHDSAFSGGVEVSLE